MIRSTYLVTMRDYLGYVSAWGFWLGLLFTPVIIGIFILAPTFAQNAQPTRYFAVIEKGDTFTNALREEMDNSTGIMARAMLDPLAIAEDRDSEKLSTFEACPSFGVFERIAYSQQTARLRRLPRVRR